MHSRSEQEPFARLGPLGDQNWHIPALPGGLVGNPKIETRQAGARQVADIEGGNHRYPVHAVAGQHRGGVSWRGAEGKAKAGKQEGGKAFHDQGRSNMAARPWPPPTHMVSRP